MQLTKKLFSQFLRFSIVGIIAAIIHYGIYYILQLCINVSVAYTIGYAISFVCNYYLTSIFTFRSKASLKRGIGFGGAHLINYTLHIVFFNIFLYLGISNELAPILVMSLVVPINFFLVHFVFSKL